MYLYQKELLTKKNKFLEQHRSQSQNHVDIHNKNSKAHPPTLKENVEKSTNIEIANEGQSSSQEYPDSEITYDNPKPFTVICSELSEVEHSKEKEVNFDIKLWYHF